MSPQRSFLAFLIVPAAILVVGCADETTDIKQKMVDFEKRLQKQEKDLREFSGKFSPPKDFSADIQRIEDQQDRISQILKTKVEPVNSKLEEFRDWAQEAQKERDYVAKKLKTLEQSAAEMQKRLEAENRVIGRVNKELAASKKTVSAVSKTVEDVSKAVGELRKEIQDNNSKVVNAVKKTLPKVKEAAVADLKEQLAPLEQGLASLRSGLESERKTIAAMRTQPPAEPPKDVQALTKRIKELEDIVTSQKAFLLEMGSKIHELEVQLRGNSGAADVSPRTMSHR